MRGSVDQARFWSSVDVRAANDCWEWTGGRQNLGYGWFYYNNTQVLAHRMAWGLANNRDIPDGLIVLHECDNRPCCNPSHLRIGTDADNSRDKTLKGRHHQTAKTHCPKGHEYSPENTQLDVNGSQGHSRRCRTCHNETNRRYRALQKCVAR